MVDSMNPEAQKNLKTSWDAFAKAYDYHMQKYMLQTFTTLAVHAKVSTRARILEVACGSGLHSLYLAKTMLRRGAALVSCDISEEMIRLAKGKFADPDAEYTVIPGNRADIEVEELAPLGKQDFDLEEHLKAGGFSEEKDRMVLARLANNECLPFKDSSFDCYLANLSLMLVDNHTNMLKEAIRVTQPGASFGFTVWGRKQNIQNFEILDDVFTKHGIKPQGPPGAKTTYDLGKDPEGLRSQMLSLGFTNVRMWYQPMNFNFKDADEYFEAIGQSNMARAVLSKLSPETREVVVNDIKAEYEKRMGGPHVLDPNSFEVLVITAIKA